MRRSKNAFNRNLKTLRDGELTTVTGSAFQTSSGAVESCATPKTQ